MSVLASAQTHRLRRGVLGLIGTAGMLAGLILAYARADKNDEVHPTVPWMLSIMALVVLLPGKSDRLRMVQKVLAFYLVGVAVNFVLHRHVGLRVLGTTVRAPISAIPLLFFCVVHLTDRMRRANQIVGRSADIVGPWIATFGVILGHMAVTAVMLRKVYGYGYEASPSAVSQVCLMFLLAVLLWRPLDGFGARSCVGLVSCVYYALRAMGKV